MNLKELIKDERTSIGQNGIDGAVYMRVMRHLRRYNFWDGEEVQIQYRSELNAGPKLPGNSAATFTNAWPEAKEGKPT
ncbi:hypothetical protein [Paracoccus saliphilus]|uniref:Uncharacterized protein n=1 Tax=Paracoccus saliphilus TaxID=405559 RepID=A0ABY7S6I2_9RHOB|nr:hypothetical protein [Paracoccus saliphilus]WCR02172.1 hypothetical protein JHX88_14845 [Paracoccus saliphilus]